MLLLIEPQLIKTIPSETSIRLGEVFPNFIVSTTHGDIVFHDWLDTSWGILLSHPADFTPVCTTELSRLIELHPEFEKRDVKVMAMSCDNLDEHYQWMRDIQAISKYGVQPGFPYPIAADPQRFLATRFGMLDPTSKDRGGIPRSCRAVFVIGPNKLLKASILYPHSSGRNMDEILRLIDSLQITESKGVLTPVDWNVGGEVFPSEGYITSQSRCVNLPSGRDYLRYSKVEHVMRKPTMEGI